MAARKANQELAAQRRSEILRAATPIFAKNGFSRTDVQEIADEMGVGKGTIYRYFPSKKKLFLAVADQGLADMVQAATAQAMTASDPIERIRLGVREYFKYFDENRDMIDIFAHERSEFRDRIEPTFLAIRDQQMVLLEMQLEELKVQGIVRDDVDTKLAASLFGDMLSGAVYTHYRIGTGKLADETDKVIDFFLHGIVK